MNKQKRLLFVATRQFWPTNSGKTTTLYYNCKELHEQYGYDIHLFCFADKETDKNREKPNFIREVVYVDAPGIKKAFWTILMKSIFTGRWPIQSALFFNRTIERQLLSYYKKVMPDVLIIDMVRLIPYMEKLRGKPVKKILIEDDLLYKRYERQLVATKEGGIAGYYTTSIPCIINWLISHSFLRNLVIHMEIRRLKQYDKKCGGWFDYVTFISQIETEEYNRVNNTKRAVTLTMGADTEYYAQGKPELYKPRTLTIVGNFTYHPNAVSLEWINNEIMPKLSSDIRCYAIGRTTKSVLAKIDTRCIVMPGYVEDIRTVVKSTDIYLSPIVYGMGIKTKVIEAMAMGMPVVTNSVGAEGLNVTNGQELMIADTADEIVDIVNRLLECTELRKQIGMRGQAFVQEHHEWKKISKVFGQMGL